MSIAQSIIDEIEAASRRLQETPVLVGIVCRPDVVAAVRQVAKEEASPMFGEVPIYEKPGQVQECLAFYDRELLRIHLEGFPL